MSESPCPIKAEWYFTEEELKKLSPSVNSGGITYSEERRHLLIGGTFIRKLADRLSDAQPDLTKISNLAVSVSLMQLRRFFTIQSLNKFDSRDVGTAILFLTSKGEECPRRLEYFVRAWYKLRQEFDSKSADEVATINREALEKFGDYITWLENIVLQTVGFNLTLELPHPLVLGLCQTHKLDRKFCEALFHLTTDILHVTNWAVRYPISTIACAVFYLAIVWKDEKMDSDTQNGTSWINKVDKALTVDLIQEMVKEFIVIWKSVDKSFHLSCSQFDQRIIPLLLDNTSLNRN